MNQIERKTEKYRAAALCEALQLDGSIRFYRMHEFWELAFWLTTFRNNF